MYSVNAIASLWIWPDKGLSNMFGWRSGRNLVSERQQIDATPKAPSFNTAVRTARYVMLQVDEKLQLRLGLLKKTCADNGD